MSIFSQCYASMRSLCYGRFGVCVMCLVFRLCYVWCSNASDPCFACGSLRSLAAALRPQAIIPKIIVFVVHGLTFMNFSAPEFQSGLPFWKGAVDKQNTSCDIAMDEKIHRAPEQGYSCFAERHSSLTGEARKALSALVLCLHFCSSSPVRLPLSVKLGRVEVQFQVG